MTIDEIRDNDIFTGREVKRMLRSILEGEGDVSVAAAPRATAGAAA